MTELITYKSDAKTMSYPEIIHIADIHHHGKNNSHIKYAYQRLLDVLNKKRDNCILVVAGDIFDLKTIVKDEDIAIYQWFLNELEMRKITTILMPGNHDYNPNAENPTNLVEQLTNSAYEYVKCYSNTTVRRLKGIDFHIFSPIDGIHPPRPDPSSKVPSVAIIHDMVRGCKLNNFMNAGDEHNCFKLTAKELSERYSIVCLGDIHKQQFLTKNVAYCGSFVQKTKGEDLQHGYISWDVSKRSGVFHPLVQLSVYVTVVASDNKMPELPKNVIVRQLYLKHEKCSQDFIAKLVQKIFVHYNRTPDSIENLTPDELEEKFDFQDLDSHEVVIKKILTEQKKGEDEIKRVIDFHRETTDKTHKQINSWKLNYIVYDNILGSGENNFIDFREAKGMTALIGKNGYGKSTTMDAIIFALWGIYLRATKSSFVNTKKSHGRVKCSFQIHEDEYIIQRYVSSSRNDNIAFHKNGNLQAGATTQEVNRQIIGLIGDHLTFLHVMCAKQNRGYLSDMGQSDMYKLLNEYFGISIYAGIEKKLTTERNTMKRNYTKGMTRFKSYYPDIVISRDFLAKKQKTMEAIEKKIEELEQKKKETKDKKAQMQAEKESLMKQMIYSDDLDNVSMSDLTVSALDKLELNRELEALGSLPNKKLPCTGRAPQLKKMLSEATTDRKEFIRRSRYTEQIKMYEKQIEDITHRSNLLMLSDDDLDIIDSLLQIDEEDIRLCDVDLAKLSKMIEEKKTVMKESNESTTDDYYDVKAEYKRLKEEMKKLKKPQHVNIENISDIDSADDIDENCEMSGYTISELAQLMSKLKKALKKFDKTSEGWEAQIKKYNKLAREIPDEYYDEIFNFVVLSGLQTVQFSSGEVKHRDSGKTKWLKDENAVKDKIAECERIARNCEKDTKDIKHQISVANYDTEKLEKQIGSVKDKYKHLKYDEECECCESNEKLIGSINNLDYLNSRSEEAKKNIQDLKNGLGATIETMKCNATLLEEYQQHLKYLTNTKKLNWYMHIKINISVVQGLIARAERNEATRDNKIWNESHKKLERLESELSNLKKSMKYYKKTETELHALEDFQKHYTKFMKRKADGAQLISEYKSKIAKCTIDVEEEYQSALDSAKLWRDELAEEEKNQYINKIIDKKNHIDKCERLMEQLRSNEALENQIDKITIEIDQTDARYETILDEISASGVKREKTANTIKLLKKMLDDCERISGRINTLTDYIYCIGTKTGLPYMILKTKMNKLNLYCNRLLKTTMGYELDFKLDNGTMSLDFKNNDRIVSARAISGSQKFCIDLIMRYALSMMRPPKANFLLVDEGFGCLDGDNFREIIDFIAEMKKQYDFIMIITHFTELKNMADAHIMVEMKHGFGNVQFGTKMTDDEKKITIASRKGRSAKKTKTSTAKEKAATVKAKKVDIAEIPAEDVPAENVLTEDKKEGKEENTDDDAENADGADDVKENADGADDAEDADGADDVKENTENTENTDDVKENTDETYDFGDEDESVSDDDLEPIIPKRKKTLRNKKRIAKAAKVMEAEAVKSGAVKKKPKAQKRKMTSDEVFQMEEFTTGIYKKIEGNERKFHCVVCGGDRLIRNAKSHSKAKTHIKGVNYANGKGYKL